MARESSCFDLICLQPLLPPYPNADQISTPTALFHISFTSNWAEFVDSINSICKFYEDGPVLCCRSKWAMLTSTFVPL
jgi:hypothetical protein